MRAWIETQNGLCVSTTVDQVPVQVPRVTTQWNNGAGHETEMGRRPVDNVAAYMEDGQYSIKDGRPVNGKSRRLCGANGWRSEGLDGRPRCPKY